MALLLAAGPVGATEWTVEADLDAFSPDALTVRVGDTVTWVSRTPVPHEMAFDADPTGAAPGPRRWVLGRTPVVLTVTRPGRYTYRCGWHGMYGSLTVLPAAGAP